MIRVSSTLEVARTLPSIHVTPFGRAVFLNTDKEPRTHIDEIACIVFVQFYIHDEGGVNGVRRGLVAAATPQSHALLLLAFTVRTHKQDT